MSKLLVLTGEDLTIEDLVNVSLDDGGHVKIVVEEEGNYRVEAARRKLEELVLGGMTVYGTTTKTGPGLSKTKLPEDNEAYIEVAAGYATRWGKGVATYTPGVCRAAWTILCNSFAKGTSTVSVDLVKEVTLWLNKSWNKNEDLLSALPSVEKSASIGHGDVVAPVQLLFGTLCQRSLSRELYQRYLFKSGEVLAMLSTNSFTLAESSMCLVKFEKILKLCEEITVLDMEAEEVTTALICEAAERVAQWEEKKEVINKMRGLLKGSSLWKRQPSSINPFVSLRASPDLLGCAWASLNSAKKVVTELINSHQGNPLVAGDWLGKHSQDQSHLEDHIGSICHFDSTRLFCSLSNVQQAFGCLAMSLGLRGEHLVKTNGDMIPSLLTRRLSIFEEAATRDTVVAGSVISPAIGRMSQAAGYDWASPAPLACAKLVDMISAIKRLIAVHCVVSCYIIKNKMSDHRQIGEGVRQLYKDINQRSFHHIENNQPFSLEPVMQFLENHFSLKSSK